MLHLIEFQT